MDIKRVFLFVAAAFLILSVWNNPTATATAFADFLGTQLDGQIDFYVRAEARHSGEARRTATLGAAAAALVAAGGATAGASGVGGEIWIAVAAGIGVVAPILVNAVRSWQEATLDREKAERYRTAYADGYHVGERYREGLKRFFQRLCRREGISFGMPKERGAERRGGTTRAGLVSG